MAAVLVVCAGVWLPSCSRGLFSGLHYPDRSRPVVRIETRGGVEYGATTADGILFLGRTAQDGPCRVHYYLGPQPTLLVEDGVIEHVGGVFYRAEIDLKQQSVPLLERDPNPNDPLLAISFDGRNTDRVPVQLALISGIEGDVLEWPGRSFPAGTGIFALQDEALRFVGLIAGEATLTTDTGEQKFLVYAGTDRLREALAVPERYPTKRTVKHRPDDITITK